MPVRRLCGVWSPQQKEHGVENYPLYQWTKATIENPAKKESI